MIINVNFIYIYIYIYIQNKLIKYILEKPLTTYTICEMMLGSLFSIPQRSI